MKTITSRDNPRFKTLRALVADARAQRRERRTLLDGIHLVAEYLEGGGVPSALVVAAGARDNAEIGRLIAACSAVDVIELRDTLFAEISGVSPAVGIAAEIGIPPQATTPLSGDCVLLDNVQDAGNVGTILRSAAAAGVRTVALGPGCAGAWTPRVLRAAQGAHFRLDLREQCDLIALLADFPGTGIATLAGAGELLYRLDLSGPLAWIFGNEGAGVTPELAAAAARRATIPLAAGNESLNVAAAMAVCVFEMRRQRSGG